MCRAATAVRAAPRSLLVEGVRRTRRRKMGSILPRAGWLCRVLGQERRQGGFGGELHCWQCWLCQDPSLGHSTGLAWLLWGLSWGVPWEHLCALGPLCMEELSEHHRELNVTAELHKTEPLTRRQAGGYFFFPGSHDFLKTFHAIVEKHPRIF